MKARHPMHPTVLGFDLHPSPDGGHAVASSEFYSGESHPVSGGHPAPGLGS